MSMVDHAAIAMIMCGVAWLSGFFGVLSCWKFIRKEVLELLSSLGGDSQCQSK